MMSATTKTLRRSGTVAKALPAKRRTAAKSTRAGARAVRRDARVQALLHDATVRDRLREGAVNARVLYLRATRRGDLAEALLEDRKGRRALRRMVTALREAFAAVRGAKRRQRRNTAMRIAVPLVVAGGAGAVAANKSARTRSGGESRSGAAGESRSSAAA